MNNIKVKHFIPNQEDNLHCFQSCFKMVYDTIFNDNMDFERVDMFTNFQSGLPTWPFKGILSFAKMGLKIINMELFPFDLFLKNPEAAIVEHAGEKEIADKIIAVSDLKSEQEFLRECMSHQNIKFIMKIPEYRDITDMLADGYFVICNVNYWSLLGEDKYDGHFVIVEEANDEYLILQNPGLPPMPSQQVKKDLFMKAWHYPNVKVANILAVKRE